VTHNFVDLDKNMEKVKLNKYIQLSEEDSNDELIIPNLENVMNSLKCEYQKKVYNLLHFIRSYINKKYHNQVIQNVEHFVQTIGKININNIKFIID
jgi:hypothetical protein